MKLFKPKAKPVFEAEVFEYRDKIVAHVQCNRCAEKFSMTLHANPVAMLMLNDAQKRALIFSNANRRHNCDPDSLQKDPAETNRIVNKWHETKRKLLKANGDTK